MTALAHANHSGYHLFLRVFSLAFSRCAPSFNLCTVLACHSQTHFAHASPLNLQVAQQHVAWLTDADGGAPTEADALLCLQGLLSTLIWAAKHGHTGLRDHVTHYFTMEAPKGTHFRQLAEAQV